MKDTLRQTSEAITNDAPSASTPEEQMIELQMSMAHLELTVERLDQVITRQDRDIQTLQRQLQLIYNQVASQNDGDGIAPFDVLADKPPHY